MRRFSPHVFCAFFPRNSTGLMETMELYLFLGVVSLYFFAHITLSRRIGFCNRSRRETQQGNVITVVTEDCCGHRHTQRYTTGSDASSNQCAWSCCNCGESIQEYYDD